MSNGKSYTTDSKEEVRKLDKAGNVETWIRIYATTKKGTYFHVDVPEAGLDKAPEILQARAERLDSI